MEGGQAVSDEEWKKRVERAVEVSTYWFEKFHAANERIKRLEEAGDAMVNEGWNEPHLANAWRKAKEAKL
jgi:hypothetical protein